MDNILQKQLQEITEKLEQGVNDIFTSENYTRYLETISKFHKYSLNNIILINMQKPDASLIAGYNAWKKLHGRQVMKGEKGIKILAPSPYKVKRMVEKVDPKTKEYIIGKDGKPVMEEKEITIPAYKVVSVFDVSQTEGRELPSLGVNELTGEVDGYKDFFEALNKSCPVPIRFEDIPNNAKGYFSHAFDYIAIKNGMSQQQTIKTALHEMAHQKLHSGDKRKEKSRTSKEIEAESTAYTVCQHYGIDTSDYSFSYVAGWSKEKDVSELKESLDTIRKASSELITDIDKALEEVTREKGKTELQQVEESRDDSVTLAPDAEPKVTIIWSDHDGFRDGEVLTLSETNKRMQNLDEIAAQEDGYYYYKTKFRIDFVLNGVPDHYEGRQDIGDGEGAMIEHIEKYHTYYANNPDWDNYLLQHEGRGALEADKEQRAMLLNEFVPYLKLHCNLSEMERIAGEALRYGERLTSTETSYHTAVQAYVAECRGLVNQGEYNLPPIPQLKDFDVELQAYKAHVEEEIAQEAAAAGMTVEEYAANGYEPYTNTAEQTIQRSSVLNNLHKKQEQIKKAEATSKEKSVDSRSHEKFERGGER
ncbi:MAG: ssDNA-binding domain-containing protein [Lachnospiraceae bacterium]|nr:ssDNA-binding domain-containing protein [Lachnospiraceae bacterium]